MHGAPPERHNVRETTRALVWALAIPATIIVLSSVNARWIALTLVYPLQAIRLAARHGIARRESWARALFSLLARFPEAQGILSYHWN